MKLFTGKRILYIIFSLLLLLGGVASYLERFIQLDTHKERIVTELSSSLHRKVSYRTGKFTFRYGPSFTFTGISINEKDSTSEFLHAGRLTLRIALLPLLDKKIIIKELDLDTPQVNVTRNRDGSLSFSDLLEQQPSSLTLQIKGIKISKGTIIFNDRMASTQNLTMILSQTDCTLSHPGRGKKGGINFSTVLSDGQRSLGSLSFKGKAHLPPADTSLLHTQLDLEITTVGLEAAPFWPYYSKYVPFKKILGKLSTQSSFKGELARFTAKGSFRITGGRLDYQPTFHRVLEPKNVAATYTLNCSRDEVDVSAIDATVDGVRIKGSCAIRELTTGDPRIIAKATSTPIPLEAFSQYIPYGVIVREPSEFIEQKIKGGVVRINEGTLLNGKVSQILTMEKGTNYNVLAVRGTIEKGIINWGSGVPLFTEVKGELELAGKDFNLKKMTGRFGSSPFSLDGALKDYPVDSPTLYHFTMAMTPSPADTAWLFRFGKDNPATFNGKSMLQLTGEGPTKNYTISGSWDLAQAYYTLPGILTKPAGMPNSASFRLEFTPDKATLKDIQYQLPPLTARGSAVYHFEEDEGFEFTLTTNQFALGNLAPLAPRISKYQPKGTLQFTVHGERPVASRPVVTSGTVNFAGASLLPWEGMKPLTELHGTVTFNANQLETSLISAKIGTTALYGKGTLRDFAKPAINIAFSSPLVDPADLGLKSVDKSFRPSRVQGSITLADQSLRISSFSTQINNSHLNLTGTIQDLRHPHADLTITSPHLELNDILALASLKAEKSLTGEKNKASLKATLKAESGKLKELSFEKLSTDIIYEDGILYLQPLEFQALGGTIASRVRVDTATGQTARYQVNYELRQISSQSLLKTLGVKKQEIWGTFSAQGDLNARGESADEIKKSLLGSISFHIESGSIRRFSSLAKIFSILNVSQLLKMRLPEMTTGGMPFSEITGTMAIKDGVFTTSDLFVRSEAMNISAVGSLNLPRNTLNVIVGVQPLQTFDKVINRIPIVGWILTGKDKSWITSYFEITGALDDPHVAVKTVSSMAAGVFNIFKRVFQLPAKLFTDTGAVILGQ